MAVVKRTSEFAVRHAVCLEGEFPLGQVLGAIQLAQASTDSARLGRAQKQSLSIGTMSKCGNLEIQAINIR